MRIGIVGAGAIGGFIAAALARAGVPVAIVARGHHLEAIRANGISVESDLGAFTVPVAASDDLRELGAFDVLLLTFKAHQWPALLPQIAAYGHSSTTIVTLQNGVPFWYAPPPPLQSVDPGGAISKALAHGQMLGGVVHVSGHIAEPGFIRQSGGTRYVLGETGGGSSARVRELAETLKSAGLAPEIDEDVRRTIWLKLVNNVGLNAVSALRRMTIKPMLADARARGEVRELMEEALRVGQALGVVDDVDIDARIEYAARLDDVKTSMLQDLERGRHLEIDPILGATLELAGRAAVDVPLVRDAYERLLAASIQIRAARSEEFLEAAGLRAAMATEMGHDWDSDHPGWRARFAAYFRAKQESGDARLLFAEVGGELVGMAAFSVLDEYRAAAFGKPRGFVNGVYVAKPWRRRRIARRLMQEGLRWLKERGCVMARLRTSAEGRGLYESLGFVAGSEMERGL